MTALPSSSQPFRQITRFARRFKVATLGMVFVVLMALAAVFAPVLSRYNPTLPRIPERFQPPNVTNLLGTDDLGRDIATRILYGGRNTLAAGFLSVIVATLVGSAIGILAAYRGGWPIQQWVLTTLTLIMMASRIY